MNKLYFNLPNTMQIVDLNGNIITDQQEAHDAMELYNFDFSLIPQYTIVGVSSVLSTIIKQLEQQIDSKNEIITDNNLEIKNLTNQIADHKATWYGRLEKFFGLK